MYVQASSSSICRLECSNKRGTSARGARWSSRNRSLAFPLTVATSSIHSAADLLVSLSYQYVRSATRPGSPFPPPRPAGFVHSLLCFPRLQPSALFSPSFLLLHVAHPALFFTCLFTVRSTANVQLAGLDKEVSPSLSREALEQHHRLLPVVEGRITRAHTCPLSRLFLISSSPSTSSLMTSRVSPPSRRSLSLWKLRVNPALPCPSLPAPCSSTLVALSLSPVIISTSTAKTQVPKAVTFLGLVALVSSSSA